MSAELFTPSAAENMTGSKPPAEGYVSNGRKQILRKQIQKHVEQMSNKTMLRAIVQSVSVWEEGEMGSGGEQHPHIQPVSLAFRDPPFSPTPAACKLPALLQLKES